MNIINQKKIIILLAVFTIIVVAFNKSYALFQATAVSDKTVVQITTPDKLPKPSTGVGKELLDYDIKVKKETCNPIIEDSDGTIYFSGDNDCIDFNYVWYSGKLWRITAINPDGSIKMVTQNEITAIFWGSDTTYQDSWIYQWLNEDFKETLYNKENIIVENASWNATADGNDIPVKPSTDSSATIVQGDVGTLNAYEYYQSYKNTSSRNGYLNIDYSWWLITPDTGSYVRSVWGVGIWNSKSPSSSAYGVRPSVILKSNIELKGAGTKSNPYMIKGDKETGTRDEFINTRLSGEYVKVDEKVYRIVGIENGTTKLTSVDYVKDGGEVLTKFFSSSSGDVLYGSGSTMYATSWAGYLNNTWLTENLKQYITNGTYYLGQVGSGESYKNSICSASNTKETTKDCEKTTSTWTEGLVGLPRVGEMFSAQLADNKNGTTISEILLITPSSGSGVWRVDRIGYLNRFPPNSNMTGVRPSINLKSEVKISGGSGTESSPYEVKIGN